MRAAAEAGLAAAATKAKLFADHEEREIQRLSANIVNHQVFLVIALLFENIPTIFFFLKFAVIFIIVLIIYSYVWERLNCCFLDMKPKF